MLRANHESVDYYNRQKQAAWYSPEDESTAGKDLLGAQDADHNERLLFLQVLQYAKHHCQENPADESANDIGISPGLGESTPLQSQDIAQESGKNKDRTCQVHL